MISTQFLNMLGRLDKTLYLELDKKIQRYVIYRKDRQNVPRKILVIDDSGNFCYPNYDHIAKLYEMDSWQNKNLIKDIDEHNERLDEDATAAMKRLNREVSLVATRSAYY